MFGAMTMAPVFFEGVAAIDRGFQRRLSVVASVAPQASETMIAAL
jgi:hypothetical protein